jgi:hypothetical protein
MSIRLIVVGCGLALWTALLAAGQDHAGAAEWQRITILNETYSVVPGSVVKELGIPHRDIPDDKNAATYYFQAINALPPMDAVPEDQYDRALKGPWSAEDAPQLHEWYAATEESRRLLRLAASQRDCQFPVLVKQPGPVILFAVLLPHLSNLRQCARLLVIEGMYLEKQGKMDEAFQTWCLTLPIGKHISQSPLLISGLVGIAIQSMGINAIQGSLQRNDIPPQQLAWLAAQLELGEGFLPDRTAWISGEKAAAHQITEPQFIGSLRNLNVDVPATEGGSALLGSRAFRILYPDRTILADLNRCYAHWEDLSGRPAWEMVAEVRRNPDDQLIRQQVKPWNIFAGLLLPALGRAQTQYARAECSLNAVRLDVALRRFRGQAGIYPDGLDQLTPEFVPIPILDPFSGKPFLYQNLGDDWLLYSVGFKQTDGGGVSEKGDPIGERGDIVYRAKPVMENVP